MPCFVAALAFFFPRITIILVALLSDYIGRAFNNEVLWPILGFLFMPYTLLAYAFAMNQNSGSVSGLYLALVVVAVLFDFGVLGGGARTSRKRMGKGKG